MTGYLCRNTRVARFFVGKEMHMNYEKLSSSIRAAIDRRPGDNGGYGGFPGDGHAVSKGTGKGLGR